LSRSLLLLVAVCLAFHVTIPSCRLLFSVHSPSPPPALHPFPTRRSSDLPRARPRGRRPGSAPQPVQDREHADRPAVGGERSCTGDRKSTRLNSSHGSISYAVFCLKKKKRKHKLQPEVSQ